MSFHFDNLYDVEPWSWWSSRENCQKWPFKEQRWV